MFFKIFTLESNSLFGEAEPDTFLAVLSEDEFDFASGEYWENWEYFIEEIFLYAHGNTRQQALENLKILAKEKIIYAKKDIKILESFLKKENKFEESINTQLSREN